MKNFNKLGKVQATGNKKSCYVILMKILTSLKSLKDCVKPHSAASVRCLNLIQIIHGVVDNLLSGKCSPSDACKTVNVPLKNLLDNLGELLSCVLGNVTHGVTDLLGGVLKPCKSQKQNQGQPDKGNIVSNLVGNL